MSKYLKRIIKKRAFILFLSYLMIFGLFDNKSFAVQNPGINDLNSKTIRTASCLRYFRNQERGIVTLKKIAYITIDDGPSKYTDQIINILNKYKAKATFFMIDCNMKKYPEQVNNIISNGNSTGFHSVSHDIDRLYKTNLSAKEEFDINSETFYKITGKRSKLIRLPYGSKPYTPKDSYDALVHAGYKLWDWNIDTQDWRSNSMQIVDNVARNLENKEEIVILMHEKPQTVKALNYILELLTEEGYVFLPIRQDQEPQNFWSEELK